MSWGSGAATDKVCLEDCVFRMIMDLSSTSGKIRSSINSDYQKNADNYYYQVMNLWAIVSDYMDDEAKNSRKLIKNEAVRKYKILKSEKSYISKDRLDEVVNITYDAATQIFEVICTCLSRKGLLREQSAGAIAGRGETEDIADDELNAEIVDEIVVGSRTEPVEQH
jgi:hypothetical protein